MSKYQKILSQVSNYEQLSKNFVQNDIQTIANRLQTKLAEKNISVYHVVKQITQPEKVSSFCASLGVPDINLVAMDEATLENFRVNLAQDIEMGLMNAPNMHIVNSKRMPFASTFSGTFSIVFDNGVTLNNLSANILTLKHKCSILADKAGVLDSITNRANVPRFLVNMILNNLSDSSFPAQWENEIKNTIAMLKQKIKPDVPAHLK